MTSDVIRFLADILRKCSGPNDFVGHIGGDDFIMVCDAEKGEARCADIIRMFDNGIPEFYTEEDRKRGGIATKDRRGENRLFPIMTISIGLLTSQRSEVKEYGKLIEIASELKCLAKATDNRGKSLFFKERRK